MTARPAARSLLGWGFGMSVTILLLALWGRAVVVDTEALAESLSPLAGSEIVTDLISDWMSEEMTESGADPERVESTVGFFLRSSSVAETLDQLVVDVVHAAASPDPDGSRIDMAALFGPAVPELTLGLNGLGHAVSEADVSDVVEGFDPLVIRQPGRAALVGPSSPTAARLGTAAMLAAMALLVFGAGFVSLSEDRTAAVRNLMTRVAVGGLSFAVFLRLGAWVLDPRGGRAPIPETISALASSKWALPLQVGVVAALIAGGIYVGRRMIRREAVFPRSVDQPTRRSERPKSRSGAR